MCTVAYEDLSDMSATLFAPCSPSFVSTEGAARGAIPEEIHLMGYMRGIVLIQGTHIAHLGG